MCQGSNSATTARDEVERDRKMLNFDRDADGTFASQYANIKNRTQPKERHYRLPSNLKITA